MIKISPSVMTADFCHMGDTLKMLEKAGADWIHCDVMDGVFVPNISFGMPMVKAMNKVTDLPLDVHLMIQDPAPYIDEFIECGADFLTIHAESPGCVHLQRLLRRIKDKGAKAGVAVNPSTDPRVLEYIYEDIDLILVMSVNPGFGGQKFIPQSLRKIEFIANRLQTLGINPILEVDGGVKVDNCSAIVNAGATALVAGSAVVDSENPALAIQQLKSM